MNNHENIYDWISRYNEGDLNDEELQEFLQILATDPEIRVDTELDQELTEFLRDKDLLEFRAMLDQARFRRKRGLGLNCLLLAALLVILVALSGFWIYQNPFQRRHTMMKNEISERSDAQNSNLHEKETLFLKNTPGFPSIHFSEKPMSNDLLAANFQPLSYIEGMVGVVTRAGLFHLISPGTCVTLPPGDTLRFQWKEVRGSYLSIHIINNRGDYIVSRDSISGESMTFPTNLWAEGLYYWKFIHQDNLVNVGKIFIKK